jgi:hypothetical protein
MNSSRTHCTLLESSAWWDKLQLTTSIMKRHKDSSLDLGWNHVDIQVHQVLAIDENVFLFTTFRLCALFNDTISCCNCLASVIDK